jgi:hypothetical protein
MSIFTYLSINQALVLEGGRIMSMERTKSSSNQSHNQRNDTKQSVANKETARPFSADHILQMQSTVGNQVVQHMLTAQMKAAGAPIQRMEGLEEEELQMKAAGAPIQRMEGLEEEEELQMKAVGTPIQRMEGLEEEEELQMKAAGTPIQRMEGLEEEEELQMKKADAPLQLKANDNKMPEHVQSKMEKSIGADFSDVNIHVGSEASDVGALAYAQGSDIHFAPGQYNPESSSGQQLLGHELTHVQQQRQGRVKPTMQAKGIAVNDDAGLEREADIKGAKAAASI